MLDRIRRRRWISLAVLALLVLTAGVAEACPTCKAALAGQERYGNLPLAYMISILFMMSMPFLILGTFGTYIYLQVRKARQNLSASATLPVDNISAVDGPLEPALVGAR